MRDLFGYRWAFRCTTDSSSDISHLAAYAAHLRRKEPHHA